ncbi:MAG: hypothetical protein KH415_18175 [Clostridium sp.]|nr:hypothetical protein [Clostridium sp.]
MTLEEFLDRVLGNVMSYEGIEEVKDIIKKDMEIENFDFDTTQVEFQVFDNENNYDPRVEISSDTYDDGEIIFIDTYLDEYIISARRGD